MRGQHRLQITNQKYGSHLPFPCLPKQHLLNWKYDYLLNWKYCLRVSDFMAATLLGIAAGMDMMDPAFREASMVCVCKPMFHTRTSPSMPPVT